VLRKIAGRPMGAVSTSLALADDDPTELTTHG
jgi:hypothetical protein